MDELKVEHVGYVSLCPDDLSNDCEIVGVRAEGENSYNEYEYLVIRDNVSVYGYPGTDQQEFLLEQAIRELLKNGR